MSELRRSLIEDVFYPPHDPRKASSEYKHVHHKLVYEMDEPCWICGIKHSDWLMLPKEDQHLWQLETHHAEMEWAAANGVDLTKITNDFNTIMGDRGQLRKWLDSEGNMLVLCAKHHRGGGTGIHMITYPAWKLQRWQTKGDFEFIHQEDWRGK